MQLPLGQVNAALLRSVPADFPVSLLALARDPGHLLGRVTSAFWALHSSLGPLGSAGLAWFAGRHGAPLACLLAGTGCLLIAAGALATPARQARPERAALA